MESYNIPQLCMKLIIRTRKQKTYIDHNVLMCIYFKIIKLKYLNMNQ